MFGDDPDMYKKILNDFIESSETIIEEIHNGWKKRSEEEVNQATHKPKSSLRSIGAYELADIFLILDTASNENDWTTIDDSVSKLSQLMIKAE